MIARLDNLRMHPAVFEHLTGLTVTAFDALAAEVGVDSRDLSDDPHRSAYPVSLT